MLSGVRRARRGILAGLAIHRAKIQAGETDGLVFIGGASQNKYEAL